MEEWRSADERNTRERVSRARQAAEELFKPTPHLAEDEPPGPASHADTTAPQQRRQPRIFTIPPRLPANPEVTPLTSAAPTTRKVATRETRATVPPSQVGRVRTLATYGMTPRQVAEHYGVATEEIERILKAPARSSSPR